MPKKKLEMHGMTHTREYIIWKGMVARCEYKNATHYDKYGGSGIKICKRWRDSFLAFIEDMGRCPEKYTLDRIDSNGDYEPSNCRWASRLDQTHNRTRLIKKSGLPTGVTKDKERFRSQIKVNGSFIYIGSFYDPHLAYIAYLNAHFYWHGFFPPNAEIPTESKIFKENEIKSGANVWI